MNFFNIEKLMRLAVEFTCIVYGIDRCHFQAIFILISTLDKADIAINDAFRVTTNLFYVISRHSSLQISVNVYYALSLSCFTTSNAWNYLSVCNFLLSKRVNYHYITITYNLEDKKYFMQKKFPKNSKIELPEIQKAMIELLVVYR